MSNEENRRDEVPGKEKEFSIIINGRSNVVNAKKISYEELLVLSGIQSTGSNSLQLITYERGEHVKAEGMLSAGDKVTVKSGMVFNVSSTNKS